MTPPPLPREVDWRTHGIIGPVLDQGQCGSCVSCATTGMASSMAWKELGVRGLILSAADQHFCSSHGANCGGWTVARARPDPVARRRAGGGIPVHVGV